MSELNLEELKRLLIRVRADDWKTEAEFTLRLNSVKDYLVENVDAIVAKLEAAQRLRDALAELPELVPDPMEITKRINAALAAFDKEQQ